MKIGLPLALLLLFSLQATVSCVFIVDKPKEDKKNSVLSATVYTASDSSQAFPPVKDSPPPVPVVTDTLAADNTRNGDKPLIITGPGVIDTKNINPEDVVRFAETLVGTPYVYGSTDPKVGFDCSGFITHVFSKFNIKVPRSSIDFTDVKHAIPVEKAKRGDIILFTGTNPQERHVGHMGIVVSNSGGELKFIHSSSGKAHGVTISPLKGYYEGRFVKTLRVFPQNN
jgi:cell wall-associated NlpC family hydrolase